MVLEGSLALLAAGTRVDAGPGEIVYQPPDAGQIDLGIIVPAGTKHGVEIIAPPPPYWPCRTVTYDRL